MNCPTCQHENPEKAAFCEECGAKLERDCPQCGEPNSPSAKFCIGCGYDLSGPGESSQPSPPGQGPAIAASEGERRQATVLFSDLSGFTAMTEKLDPEEVQGLMRRLKDRAVEIVEAHGGIVSQFVGDEVLALFGIPTAHEDDPVRAVRAAQGLHELARELSPEVEEKIGRPLRMHTGIDSGLVVTSTADARDGT
ncbi:MAG: zinc ribbon domain-containing protein, partial [SAR324 cluster bacterium]|nr:zinc ribbon domain-containing protein [SAR324 cluster bacterium]